MRGCAWCLRLVPAYADSPDFCHEACQRYWHAQRSVPLGDYESDDELLIPGIPVMSLSRGGIRFDSEPQWRAPVVDVQISRSWIDRILGRRRA